MTANDLERRLADHYAREAPPRAPDGVLIDALSIIETTRQRHVLVRLPWRFQTMSNFAKVAVAGVIVIALVAIGVAVLRPSTTSESGGPAASPSTAPSQIASPNPGMSASAALTKEFASAVNGYSISYPGEWKVIAATSTWPTGSMTSNPDDPSTDSINGPSVAMYVVSQKLAAGTNPASWTQEYLKDQELNYSRLPECTVVKTEPIVVDGITGVMDTTCATEIIDVVLTSGGRAYDISLVGHPPDRAWFEEVLKTVRLHPEAAVDGPPSAAP